MLTGDKLVLTALAATTMFVSIPAYASSDGDRRGGGRGDDCRGRHCGGGSGGGSGGSTEVPAPGAVGLLAAGMFATGLMLHRKRRAKKTVAENI